jgi:hypothetical protein
VTWWKWLLIFIGMVVISGLLERWARGKRSWAWRVVRGCGKVMGWLTYLIPW